MPPSPPSKDELRTILISALSGKGNEGRDRLLSARRLHVGWLPLELAGALAYDTPYRIEDVFIFPELVDSLLVPSGTHTSMCRSNTGCGILGLVPVDKETLRKFSDALLEVSGVYRSYIGTCDPCSWHVEPCPGCIAAGDAPVRSTIVRSTETPAAWRGLLRAASQSANFLSKFDPPGDNGQCVQCLLTFLEGCSGCGQMRTAEEQSPKTLVALSEWCDDHSLQLYLLIEEEQKGGKAVTVGSRTAFTVGPAGGELLPNVIVYTQSDTHVRALNWSNSVDAYTFVKNATGLSAFGDLMADHMRRDYRAGGSPLPPNTNPNPSIPLHHKLNPHTTELTPDDCLAGGITDSTFGPESTIWRVLRDVLPTSKMILLEPLLSQAASIWHSLSPPLLASADLLGQIVIIHDNLPDRGPIDCIYEVVGFSNHASSVNLKTGEHTLLLREPANANGPAPFCLRNYGMLGEFKGFWSYAETSDIVPCMRCSCCWLPRLPQPGWTPGPLSAAFAALTGSEKWALLEACNAAGISLCSGCGLQESVIQSETMNVLGRRGRGLEASMASRPVLQWTEGGVREALERSQDLAGAGISPHLVSTHTSGLHGCGVFAECIIDKGAILGVAAGDIVDRKALKELKQKARPGSTLRIRLDERTMQLSADGSWYLVMAAPGLSSVGNVNSPSVSKRQTANAYFIQRSVPLKMSPYDDNPLYVTVVLLASLVKIEVGCEVLAAYREDYFRGPQTREWMEPRLPPLSWATLEADIPDDLDLVPFVMQHLSVSSTRCFTLYDSFAFLLGNGIVDLKMRETCKTRERAPTKETVVARAKRAFTASRVQKLLQASAAEAAGEHSYFSPTAPTVPCAPSTAHPCNIRCNAHCDATTHPLPLPTARCTQTGAKTQRIQGYPASRPTTGTVNVPSHQRSTEQPALH